MTQPLYVIKRSLARSVRGKQRGARGYGEMGTNYLHEHECVKVLERIQGALYDVRPLAELALALSCGEEGC